MYLLFLFFLQGDNAPKTDEIDIFKKISILSIDSPFGLVLVTSTDTDPLISHESQPQNPHHWPKPSHAIPA
jgi:hypothetical protein